VRIVFVVGLVLVIFDLDEVGVDSCWVQRKRDESVDSCRLRNGREEGPGLLIPELDQSRLILHNLIPLTLARLEQLRQSKPLPCHLVSIVRIDELIIVNAVRRVSLHALNGRLAAIEGEDVVDKGLTGWRQWERLGGIGSIVFGWMGLAGLEVLTRCVGGDGSTGDWGGWGRVMVGIRGHGDSVDFEKVDLSGGEWT